ncbi:helix-turn-helix transcriptional regulator, partial [Conexibacter sp. CPCC 205706]
GGGTAAGGRTAGGGDGARRRRWALAGPALACGAALSAGKLAIFLATGTSATTLAPWGGETDDATTATLAPIAIALLGVVGVTVLRRVLAATGPAGAAAPALAEPASAASPPARSAVPALAAPPPAPSAPSPPPAPASTPLPRLPGEAPISVDVIAATVPDAEEPADVAAPRLSPAERAVVALLADGLTPKQIAHERGTSVETVRTQIKRAKRATAARTLDELVASAWRPS